MRNKTKRLGICKFLVSGAFFIGVAAGVSSPSFADDGADFTGTTVDDVISTTTPDALVTVATTGLSAAHSHICVATASAEATFVAGGVFIFGIGLDGGAPATASERRIEMFDNGGINDDTFEEVSTTMGFPGLTGDHSFTFSARKNAASGGNVNVSASSMSVVCMKKDL